MFLSVLTLKQMAEDQLILVDRSLRDDQGQRPADLVVQCESLVHFEAPRGSWRHPVHILVLRLVLVGAAA